MKYNCDSWKERRQERGIFDSSDDAYREAAERTNRLRQMPAEWSRWFAVWPIKVGPRDCRWMEWVEWRVVKYGYHYHFNCFTPGRWHVEPVFEYRSIK